MCPTAMASAGKDLPKTPVTTRREWETSAWKVCWDPWLQLQPLFSCCLTCESWVSVQDISPKPGVLCWGLWGGHGKGQHGGKQVSAQQRSSALPARGVSYSRAGILVLLGAITKFQKFVGAELPMKSAHSPLSHTGSYLSRGGVPLGVSPVSWKSDVCPMWYYLWKFTFEIGKQIVTWLLKFNSSKGDLFSHSSWNFSCIFTCYLASFWNWNDCALRRHSPQHRGTIFLIFSVLKYGDKWFRW